MKAGDARHPQANRHYRDLSVIIAVTAACAAEPLLRLSLTIENARN